MVSASGALQQVTFVPLSTGRLESAVVSAPDQTGRRPAVRRAAGVCVPPGAPKLLRIPMSRTLSVTPRLGQLPFALRIRFTLPTAAVVPVFLSGHGTQVPANFGRNVWGPGRGATYTLIGTTARFDQLKLELPGGACISEATAGTFRSGA